MISIIYLWICASKVSNSRNLNCCSSGTTQGRRKLVPFNDELMENTLQIYRTSFAFRNRYQEGIGICFYQKSLLVCLFFHLTGIIFPFARRLPCWVIRFCSLLFNNKKKTRRISFQLISSLLTQRGLYDAENFRWRRGNPYSLSTAASHGKQKGVQVQELPQQISSAIRNTKVE